MRPSGPQQPVVGKEAAADHMEVEPPTPPPQQQALQLEEQSAEEPATAKVGEAKPDLALGGGTEKQAFCARSVAVSAAEAFVASRLRETSHPSKELTELSELVDRQQLELDKTFGPEADEKVQRENHIALIELHTQLLAEDVRKQAATDDVPFSLVQAGQPASSREGKGRKKQ